MSICSISEIKPETVKRSLSGFSELDWLYGYSKFPNGIYWGIPYGKISLWAGESGVGKSRAAISVAKKLVNIGARVLYFQNEVDLPTFADWVKCNYNNFIVSDDTDLKNQIKNIIMAQPNVVFVDSVNQIEEYKSGTKRDIKNIIEGYNGIEGFRGISKSLNCHIVLISQLNQDGTVKGSTTLSHLIDIEFSVILSGIDDHFLIKVGKKHRYGRTGEMFKTLWRHTDEGVESVSKYRTEDKIWCQSHNIQKIENYVPDAIREYWNNLPIEEKEDRIKKYLRTM